MNFDDEIELDYEEDEFEGGEESNCVADKDGSQSILNNTVDSKGCDDHLEIHLAEDESHFSDFPILKTPKDSENDQSEPKKSEPTNESSEQDTEMKEKVPEDKEFIRKWRAAPGKFKGDGKTMWRKPFNKSRNIKRGLVSNPWLSKFPYGKTNAVVPAYQGISQLSKNQLTTPLLRSLTGQGFRSQQQLLPHLNGNSIGNTFLGSGIYYPNYMVPGNHQWFTPLSAVQTSFSQILPLTKLQTRNNNGNVMKSSQLTGMSFQMNFDRKKNFVLPDDKNRPSFLFGRGEYSSRDAAGNCSKNSTRSNSFSKNSNSSNSSYKPVPNEYGSSKFLVLGTNTNDTGRNNSLVSFTGKPNFLNADEKEMMKVKKEARLRRFENSEELCGKKRENFMSFEKRTDNELVFEDDYFKKLQEQKQNREKICSLKETLRANHNPDIHLSDFATQSKFNIDVESLMRKKNPFETNRQVFVTKIKEERKTEEEEKMWNQQSKCKFGLTSLWVNPLKEDGEQKDSVTFVRTVSKTFDELCAPKSRCVASSDGRLLLSSSTSLPIRSVFLEDKEVDEEKDSQKEGSLLGCIVKVLNIPETANTSDVLALCKPAGRVVEVKLNSPKENSAVIRFETPTGAEKFYSLYHGRKFHNYFLNVILI